MTADPRTVIVNESDLPGLRMPGEYAVDFDHDTGQVTVLDGPQAGLVVTPNARAVAAMRVDAPVVNDAADRHNTV